CFSSRRRHTRFKCDWSSDVCSSDLMHVGAAYDRQEVQLASAHAVQGHVERVVWMDMRKIARVDNLTQPLATKTIVVATLQVLQVNDTNHPTFIADGPCTEFTGLRFL